MTSEFSWRDYSELFVDHDGTVIHCHICGQDIPNDEYLDHQAAHGQELSAAAGGLTWERVLREQTLHEKELEIAGDASLDTMTALKKFAQLQALKEDDIIVLLDDNEFTAAIEAIEEPAVKEGESVSDAWKRMALVLTRGAVKSTRR